MPDRTVRVRIAVTIDDEGEWSATGGSAMMDDEAMALSLEMLDTGMSTTWFIEAEIPMPNPTPQTIEGKVADA